MSYLCDIGFHLAVTAMSLSSLWHHKYEYHLISDTVFVMGTTDQITKAAAWATGSHVHHMVVPMTDTASPMRSHDIRTYGVGDFRFPDGRMRGRVKNNKFRVDAWAIDTGRWPPWARLRRNVIMEPLPVDRLTWHLPLRLRRKSQLVNSRRHSRRWLMLMILPWSYRRREASLAGLCWRLWYVESRVHLFLRLTQV